MFQMSFRLQRLLYRLCLLLGHTLLTDTEYYHIFTAHLSTFQNIVENITCKIHVHDMRQPGLVIAIF
jgi:hypothetical protein